MYDKQKIISMTTLLEKFVLEHKNIYVLPEVLTGSIFSLLKRLNVNIAAVLTNSEVPPEKNLLQTPVGNFPLINTAAIFQNFNFSTGLIIFAAKPLANPITSINFNVGDLKIGVPAFVVTHAEALSIYDRLNMIQLINQYQADGVAVNVKEISHRFARGISSFIDAQFQDVKVQVWDRREFKIPHYDVDDAAIVIQGPIQYGGDYTLTNARLYREWYPKIPIVISTWKNEVTADFHEECKKISVVVLENDPPEEDNRMHLNHQLKSSFEGAKFIKENTSAKYVLKCRTDQRLNRMDFLIYFKNLLKMFPPKDNKINSRIILLAWTKWWPWFAHDLVYFGDIDDMLKLLGVPELHGKELEKIKMRHSDHGFGKIIRFNTLMPDLKIKHDRKLINYNLAMYKNFLVPEIYILVAFYNKYIAPIEPEKYLQAYLKFLRDYSIIVDKGDVLYDFPKYNYGVGGLTYNAFSYYDGDLDHARWLDIYLNYKDEDD